MSSASLADALRENAFCVLGLPVTASRLEVEREGQKLLGMLELGLSASKTYATPLGVQARDADKVRAAMGELRDPARRLFHELVAKLPPTTVEPFPPEPAARSTFRFAQAFAAVGLERPKD